ncbi:unnamed protein product [Lupinus luteus]|uniref:Uncharacterized protein n=1 Tax=Lupinus luteus TaxID=3873 RepID=A0AAV1XH85_LUPLU
MGDEAKKQLWLAGPMICVSVFQYSLQMISLIFVGHLDELFLAAAALATSFVSVTGFSVMMGLSSVLDTFCGQSYGAQQYEMVGIHTQSHVGNRYLNIFYEGADSFLFDIFKYEVR